MPRSKNPKTTRVFTTDQIAQFREIYFRTGNIAECQRQLGISYDKCRTLARQANADPEFIKLRKEAFNSLLADVEAMLTETAQEINRRVLQPDPTLEELSKYKITYSNPKPGYFKSLVDWYKSLAFHRRAVRDAELKEERAKAGEVAKEPTHVNVYLKGDDEGTD